MQSVAALAVFCPSRCPMSQEQSQSPSVPAADKVHGIPVQPLTEWLAVMTEEVQRKEEAARLAAASPKRR